MESFRDNIGSLANTGAIENILMGIAYWLVVLVIGLFIAYVAVRIRNYVTYRKQDNSKEKDELII